MLIMLMSDVNIHTNSPSQRLQPKAPAKGSSQRLQPRAGQPLAEVSLWPRSAFGGGSVLETANRKPVGPGSVMHPRIATVEAHVASERTINCRRPIVTDATHLAERGIAILPVAAGSEF